jgi:hypothetical protein
MREKWNYLIVLVGVAVLVTGCGGGRTLGVNIDSISRPDSVGKLSYLLLPGNKDTDPSNLQYQEFAAYVFRALTLRGFSQTESLENADVVILLAYGIGNPLSHQYTYSIPVWGQTGYSSSTTSGTVRMYGGYGTYSGETTYKPTYGITGYSTQVGTYTTYTRWVILDAYDVETFKLENKLNQVWRSSLVSTGPVGDLRQAFPIIIAASTSYLATNPGKTVKVKIKEQDPMVAKIKGVEPK